jgi:hypothetical protein
MPPVHALALDLSLLVDGVINIRREVVRLALQARSVKEGLQICFRRLCIHKFATAWTKGHRLCLKCANILTVGPRPLPVARPSRRLLWL